MWNVRQVGLVLCGLMLGACREAVVSPGPDLRVIAVQSRTTRFVGAYPFANLHQFDLEAGVRPVKVQCLGVLLEFLSHNGALLTGSSGTGYFARLRVENIEGGAPLLGPALQVPPPGTQVNAENLCGSLIVPAQRRLSLALIADLAETEDRPGEFFGNSYTLTVGHNIAGVLFPPGSVCFADELGNCVDPNLPNDLDHPNGDQLVIESNMLQFEHLSILPR